MEMENSTSTFKAEAGTISYNVKLYSFKKGLIKTAINIAIFGIPFLITSFPEYMNLSLGGALYLLVNYLKQNYK